MYLHTPDLHLNRRLRSWFWRSHVSGLGPAFSRQWWCRLRSMDGCHLGRFLERKMGSFMVSDDWPIWASCKWLSL
jgi:hypothetical protein